jgi:hypothetical protein
MYGGQAHSLSVTLLPMKLAAVEDYKLYCSRASKSGYVSQHKYQDQYLLLVPFLRQSELSPADSATVATYRLVQSYTTGLSCHFEYTAPLHKGAPSAVPPLHDDLASLERARAYDLPSVLLSLNAKILPPFGKTGLPMCQISSMACLQSNEQSCAIFLCLF